MTTLFDRLLLKFGLQRVATEQPNSVEKVAPIEEPLHYRVVEGMDCDGAVQLDLCLGFDLVVEPDGMVNIQVSNLLLTPVGDKGTSYLNKNSPEVLRSTIALLCTAAAQHMHTSTMKLTKDLIDENGSPIPADTKEFVN